MIDMCVHITDFIVEDRRSEFYQVALNFLNDRY